MIREPRKTKRVYKRGEHTPLLPGAKFGRLTVVKYSHSVSYGHSKQKQVSNKYHYECACICGNNPVIDKQSLLTGKTVSCGCKRQEGRPGSRKKNPVYNMWYNASRRAFQKKLEFTIDLKDIVVPEVCPALGIPLKFNTRTHYDNSPSLDRIDNTKGYTPDNIWVISYLANQIKNMYSYEQLKAVVDAMAIKLNKEIHNNDASVLS